MPKTKTPATTNGESGKTYGYQSAETAPAGGTSGLTTKREVLFKAFEDFIDTMVSDYRAATLGPGASGPGTTTGTDAASTGTTGTGTASTGTGTTGTTGAGTTGGAASTGGTGTTSGHPSTGTPSSSSAGGPHEATTTHPHGHAAETAELPISVLRESYQQDQTRAATRRAEAAKLANSHAPSREEIARKHTSDSNRAPFSKTQEFAPAYGIRGRSQAPTPEVAAMRPGQKERPETAPAAPTTGGVMLDAYWASFGTPVERAQERARILSKQRPEMQQLELIIGSDDRVLVTNNELYPWRCICSLLITAQSGTMYLGTGWLVSPRVVLTAGHCVYMSDEGGWATQIEVIPGRFGDKRPFGSAVSGDLRSVTGFTVDNDRDYDYGAILLPEDHRFGDDLGWFGYTNRDDDYLKNITVNLAGYPGDGGKAGPERQQGTPWFMSRGISEVNEKQIRYEIDTWGGQSGSPVWEMAADGSRYGVAIHTWGTEVSNGGTRITQEVFANIVSWAGQAP